MDSKKEEIIEKKIFIKSILDNVKSSYILSNIFWLLKKKYIIKTNSA